MVGRALRPVALANPFAQQVTAFDIEFKFRPILLNCIPFSIDSHLLLNGSTNHGILQVMHTKDLMINVCLDIYKIKISISYLTTNSLGNDVFNTPKAFLKSTFCLLKFY